MTFPPPLVFAWACYNAFVALRIAANRGPGTLAALVMMLTVGGGSVLLLGQGYINAFAYYELGVGLLMLAISLHTDSVPDRRGILVGAMGRCYLAGGVWLLS